MAPKGYCNILKKLIVPAEGDSDLDGRAMILIFKSGNVSFSVACVYAQVNQAHQKNGKGVERLWRWAQMHLEQISGNVFVASSGTFAPGIATLTMMPTTTCSPR